MNMTIDGFAELIMGLRPNNFMALNGAAPGIIGSADSGSAAVAQLQQAALEFMRLYKNAGAAETLQAARRDLTGKIMVALTVDAITEPKADELLGALHQIMKERS